jgi:alpha-mannosidase
MSLQVLSLDKIKVNPKEWSNAIETDTCFILENEFFRAEIHKQAGTLVSLYLKQAQKELIAVDNSAYHLGSGLRVFHDHPKTYPAWNIERTYARRHVKVSIQDPPRIIKDATGTLMIKTIYKYLKSTATVIFYVRPKDPLLNVKIITDHKDPKIFVKYYFPLTLKSPWVQSEIPYASIARKRVKHTEFEKGKWEMNMQKWVDISDEDCGLTILNKDRYGFNATPRGIYITLTRTPVYSSTPFHSAHKLLHGKDRPKYLDFGEHTFELGLQPHLKNWQEINVWQAGYSYNLPLISESLLDLEDPDWRHDIRLEEYPEQLQSTLLTPFVQTDSPNVIIGAIKPTEWMGDSFDKLETELKWKWDQHSVIIRIVEQAGKNTETKLVFNSNLEIKTVEEVDLLERSYTPPQDPDVIPVQMINQSIIEFTIKRFEIKTLKITF